MKRRLLCLFIVMIPATVFAGVDGYRVQTFGGGPPGFEQPRCVRVGPRGRVWFLQGSNGTVGGRVLGKDFETVLRFGLNGRASEKPGRWYHPASLRPSSGGVLVADTGNRRVLRFDLDGNFSGVVVPEGKSPDALAGPTDALQLADGRIVVCDAGSSRVLLFDKRGRLERVIASPGAEPDQVDHAFSLALDGEGDLWIVDTLNHRLVERDGRFAVKRVVRPFEDEHPLFRWITYLDFDVRGNLYVVDGGASCVLKFSLDGKLLTRIPTRRENGPRPLVTPSGLAVTPGGKLLVADVDRNVFVRFERDGRFLDVIGLPHSRKERIHPVAFAAGADGVVFQVWSQPESMVCAFGPGGVLLSEFGGRGNVSGKFIRPRDAAVGPDGNVYVADSQRHDITVYRPDGVLVRVFGRLGNGPSDVHYPRAVAVAGDGKVFVGDAGNRRIQIFEATGGFVRTFATGVNPYRIDVDARGRVAIHDDADETLILFDRDGLELRRIPLKGRFNITGPVFGPDGRLWLLDRSAARIRTFGEDGSETELARHGRLHETRALFRGRDGRVRAGFDFGVATLKPDGAIGTFTPALRQADPGHPLMPVSLAFLGNGELAVLSRQTGSVHVFGRDGTFRRMLRLDRAISGPRQLVPGPKGGLCVLCPFQGEILRLADGRAERIAAGEMLRMARAFVLDGSGNVFVLDARGRAIHKLDRDGRETATLRSRRGEQAFRRASALAITPAGDVLIADGRHGNIFCYGPDLTFKWMVDQEKLENRQRLWGGVCALHMDVKGRLLVLSRYGNTVQVFGPDRKHVRNIHLDVNGSGALKLPEDLLVAPDGTVYIADTGNNRIVRLTPVAKPETPRPTQVE